MKSEQEKTLRKAQGCTEFSHTPQALYSSAINMQARTWVGKQVDCALVS